jgi:hypothetical protein
MREFTIDLLGARSREDFISAVNAGLCEKVGGHWHGKSWDAFHDYLSWPEEESFRLIVRGWLAFSGLTPEERKIVSDIFRDNSHVETVLT